MTEAEATSAKNAQVHSVISTPSEMTERQLDIAICEALGWPTHEWEWTGSPSPFMRAAHCLARERMPAGEHPPKCIPLHDDHRALFVPAFTQSVDALRDGPEAKLIEAGWAISVFTTLGGANVEWFRHPGDGFTTASADGDTEARARAEAALLALSAIEEVAAK